MGFVTIVGFSPGGYHSEEVDGLANQKNIAECGLNCVIFIVRDE